MAQKGVFIVFMGLLISIMFKRTLSYQIQATQQNYEKWDKDHVTAADYTVVLEVTEKMIENYKKEGNDMRNIGDRI